MSIRNCLVTRNRTGSGGMGAGLYTEGANATVEDCEFSYNDATGSFSDGGGAAATWGETTSSVFRRVVFRSNTAGSNGGGLFQGSLADDCSFIAVPELRSRFLRGYPNPFNPSVTIEFALPSPALARVTIYDVAGREFWTLWNGPAAGVMRLGWDGDDDAGRDAGTGIYFARLVAPGRQEVLKLVMVK